MNESLSRYWENTKQYWMQFSRTQKIMIISVFALTVLALSLLVYYFSRTEYKWAYYDLDATDMAAVTDYLDTAGIPYQYGADGTSIAVPSSQVTEVKVDVAAQNLVQSGKQGFGLFRDNISGFGMTDKEFDLLSVDGRAGEIEKLLNSYPTVSRSLVLLSMPEDSVFAAPGEADTASASVHVMFKENFRPDQSMIDSMYNLVRSSVGVDKLPTENITIIDQSGIQLMPSNVSDGGVGQAMNAIEQQMQIKKDYESGIKTNVEAFLRPIIGLDRVVVSVVSSINFDQRNRQEKLFEPVDKDQMKGIERSVQEVQKSFSSENGAAPSGVPGTGGTDVPGYQESDSGKSESEEVSKTTNYEVNEITQSISSSPYVVQDLTISVALEPTEEKPITEAMQDQIKNMLSTIIGTSLANSGQTFTQDELNNRVTVFPATFEGRTEIPAPSQTSTFLYYGLAAAALALIAFGGFFVFRRSKKESAEEPIPTTTPSMEIPSIDYENASHDQQVRKQLESLAKKKPEEFVNLLRTWLVDE
ncbi:flagellar basal-body MS-ring/collar protein FliF [Marinicrinis sediminis]|uniref:Flagellar basal-body MS-ring/collar protein FliF n=1 Tax=Marinicrinis sediminis TaxID=1652465 RepID=A0ABW5R5T0_9BACL